MAREPKGAYDVITLKGDGGLVQLTAQFKIPNFAEVQGRARDLRPVFERVKALGWLEDASAYQRDDRFIGGWGRADKDGRRRNWGPGYKRRQYGRTKRTLTVRSRRPYHPRTTEQTDLRITQACLDYIITGALP